MALYSIDHEKQFLSAAIRNPLLLAEVKIGVADFSAANRDVFEALRQTATTAGEGYSKLLLIERLNALGAKIGGVLDPKVYIDALDLLNVSDKAAKGVADEIRQTTVRRELNAIGNQIVEATTDSKSATKRSTELVGEVTKIFNDRVNIIEGGQQDEPVDLYGTVDRFLDEQTHYDTRSIATPFRIYNDMYGSFDPGNLVTVCARLKVGKSTLALSTLQQIAAQDKNNTFRALILDTELTTDEVQSRALSSLSGVGEFYIRHKLYRKNKVMTEKVERARAAMKPLWSKVDHLFIGGWSLESQISAARRWAFKHLREPGKRGMMVLDYFKLSGGDYDSRTSRDILLGKRVDAYKNLSKEIHLPILCFCQANRENEDTKLGQRIQNATVIAGSDMIGQFSSNVMLLERLSPMERAQLNQIGPDAATHSLKAIATRQLGPDELGQNRLVKFKDDRGKERYCENFLLYRFSNFAVAEVGTFKDIVDRGALVANVQSDPHTPVGTLL